jgi:DNA-binding NarL/FixJ family response regulator
MAQEMIDFSSVIGHNGDMAKTSVMVVDSDDLARRAFGRTAASLGFDLAGEATTAIDAVRQMAYTPADVVIMANEMQGLTGIDVTAELTDMGKRVIIVSGDSFALEQARAAGAFAAIPRGDLGALERVLEGIGRVAVEGERRSGADRRAGQDRRVAQDWSKVIRERRAGEDRRSAERRDAERRDAAASA